MKISHISTKLHPLKALWEDEQTQGQINGRTGTALLIYPGKSHGSSHGVHPLMPAGLSTHPWFQLRRDQELSLTLITVRLLRFCATCGHLEPQKLAGSERQSVTAPIILTKAKAKELVPDVMNFSACFPLDLSKMLLLGGFTHSIRGSGNVSSIPPLPSQSCWRKLKMFHLHRGWRTCDGQQLHERARDFISGFSLGLWVPASLF